MDRYKLWARVMARDCVRNTFLEDLHAGTTPSSAAGDDSDVRVVSPYGEIPWERLSRISDPEMRKLMLEVESKLAQYLRLFHELADDPTVLRGIEAECFGERGISWDIPDDKYREIHGREPGTARPPAA